MFNKVQVHRFASSTETGDTSLVFLFFFSFFPLYPPSVDFYDTATFYGIPVSPSCLFTHVSRLSATFDGLLHYPRLRIADPRVAATIDTQVFMKLNPELLGNKIMDRTGLHQSL